ncbi:MAG: hypothetical protein Q9227_000881 [Pyrenula ochraceoflavens]
MSGRATPWICRRCLRAQHSRRPHDDLRFFPGSGRTISISSKSQQAQDAENDDGQSEKKDHNNDDKGAMSRRLAEMAEETIDSGDRSARKAVEEAGFSEELKKRLEERITGSTFRNENPQAFAQAEMPPWTGQESVEDAALRMLDDSHKKLRSPVRAPRTPTGTNLRPAPKPKLASAGTRLANARDRTSIYALSQQTDMTDKEREQMRKELKERFTPGARPMPTSLQGLTSLANERIEDAISRGQFKNIPRGKGKNTERDHNANSPFLDTTEYFMNKIIQKQEIVPPWIEKQQELVKATETFRKRLRNDWRRHAARTISSQGGSLESQIKRATAYALAEELLNPKAPKKETLNRIDLQGNLSTVTVEEKPPDAAEQILLESGGDAAPEATITITEEAPEATSAPSEPPTESITSSTKTKPSGPSSVNMSSSPSSSSALPASHPFRDLTWESTELSYHTLAITNLNTQTRSYNLQAPKLAQKPYFNLQRELNRCYADVGPELPAEIRARANAPKKVRVEVKGHREGGVMERFGAGERVKVYDEDLGRKGYGFKEFWRDLWGEGEKAKI